VRALDSGVQTTVPRDAVVAHLAAYR
jgi:hypothetical protein